MWDKGIGFKTNIFKKCVPVWHENSQQRTASMEPNRWLRLILNFYGKKSNFTGEYGGGPVYFPNGVVLEPSSVSQICHLRSREACQDKLSSTEPARWGSPRPQPGQQLHAQPPCRSVTPPPAAPHPRSGVSCASSRSASDPSPAAESGHGAVLQVTQMPPSHTEHARTRLKRRKWIF